MKAMAANLSAAQQAGPARSPGVAASRARAIPVASPASARLSTCLASRPKLEQHTARRRSTHVRAIASNGPPATGSAQDEDMQRMLQETREVEDRIRFVYNAADFDREMVEAGSKLVVLEVMSDTVCEVAEDVPLAEIQWKEERPTEEQLYAPCKDIKSAVVRTARSCQDVVFLALVGDSDEDTEELCDRIGITTYPTQQFYRNGLFLWETKGFQETTEGLDSGLLYYGAAALGVEPADQFVKNCNSLAEIEHVIDNAGDELVVLDVSTRSGKGCIQVFPTVVAMAKSMGGYARFCRITVDDCPGGQEVVDTFKIVEAPTFMFFWRGQYVRRHVGSSRGDLIGHILEVGSSMGLKPPAPGPGAGGTARQQRQMPPQQPGRRQWTR